MKKRSQKPNFIFIMTDEENLRGLSCYKGKVIETPTADKMAREGVLFENAYCSCPQCMPSRATCMTGRHPHVNGVRNNGMHLPEKEISLPEIFNKSGYKTALCGKDHCFSPIAREKLFDYIFEGGHGGIRSEIPADFSKDSKEANDYFKNEMRPKVFNSLGGGVLPFAPEDCEGGVITEAAIRFIRQEKDNPFFVWLSYSGPHWPFMCPEAYENTVPPEKVDLPPVDDLKGKPERQAVARKILGMDKASEGELRKVMSLYYGNCRYIDDQIGRVFSLLKELGLEEDTIVHFTSDHGDYLGEHGMMHKTAAVYDCLTKIPYIWWWPGHIKSGNRRPELASNADLLPTVLELCEIKAPPGVQGISQAGGMLGKSDYQQPEVCFSAIGHEGEAYTLEDLNRITLPEKADSNWKDAMQKADRTGCGRIKMVRNQRWKLAHYTNGDGELYDMQEDPWELNNLFNSPDHQLIVDELRTHLLKWLIDTEDTIPPLRAEDRETYKTFIHYREGR